MRFHFNAHNLVVYGKRGDNYLISDPVIDILVECDAAALQKARFTRGVLAPKGMLYYPEYIPRTARPAARRSARRILFTTGTMLYAPLPIMGVRGIRLVARKVRKLDPREERHNKLLLGHIVRMQEEIGTGGAGFRFLYASVPAGGGRRCWTGPGWSDIAARTHGRGRRMAALRPAMPPRCARTACPWTTACWRTASCGLRGRRGEDLPASYGPR